MEETSLTANAVVLKFAPEMGLFNSMNVLYSPSCARGYGQELHLYIMDLISTVEMGIKGIFVDMLGGNSHK